MRMECDQPKEKRINSGIQDEHFYAELKTWLSKNEVSKLPESDVILRYSDKEHREVLGASPWTKDPHYFKVCKVSAVALLKMLIHAHSGGNIEVSFWRLWRLLCPENVVEAERSTPRISFRSRFTERMNPWEVSIFGRAEHTDKLLTRMKSF